MSTVIVERDREVAIITINRPDVRNAVDIPTAEALTRAFQAYERDDALNVAVLTGSGGAFCAGADLKAIAGGERRDLKENGLAPLGPTRMLLSKPVIAAVEGHAVAGGLELALWCDMRVAAADAVFGVYCRRWGVPLCDGGTVRLPRLIGQSHALDMILTGRGVGGEEAARMGLVNRLCEPGEALDTARRLAITLARLPQACLRSDRKSMYEQWETDVATALRRESELGLEVIGSGEVGRGLTHWRSGAWSFSDFAEA